MSISRYRKAVGACLLQLLFIPFVAAQAADPAAARPPLAPLSVFKTTWPGGAEGPAMVVIPPGSFDMGSDDADTDEQPVHRVTLAKPFALGVSEVTQKQWRQVMGEDYDGLEFPGCDDCPVDSVSWDDVQQFLKKLNNLTRLEYRLPSEAEWEYACRAGTADDRYCGGNNEDALTWYAKNSSADGNVRHRKTHPVAQKRANAWGLYDMSGNVQEWVQDVAHANYHGAPTDGSAWIKGGKQQLRIMRGGAWDDYRPFLRAAVRRPVEADWGLAGFGFRLARSLP